MTAPSSMVGKINVQLDLPEDSARKRAALRAVLDVHRAVRIYDECGHHHEYAEDGTVPAGMFDVPEIGLVCQAGYGYSICRECCADVVDSQVYQRQVCCDHHRHGNEETACWPCHTVQAIAEPLGVKP